MGVQARIVLYAPDSAVAEQAARAAFDRIAVLDGVMSDYRQDSELMRFVRRGAAGPVALSGDLFQILDISQRLARQSDGAFDVTVGPVVSLWRRARRERALPPKDSLDSALDRTGWRKLDLDPDGKTARLSSQGMRLDLGGIAKGYAADAAMAVLRSNGIDRALIEFGGDIVVGDPPPDAAGWRVTVALSDPSHRELTLSNRAVSTSGDTQQFVEIDGVRYSHVVDPRTGIGLTSRIAVTVIAPSGTLSDGLATALSVMGPEDGLEMIAREYPQVQAFVRHLPDG